MIPEFGFFAGDQQHIVTMPGIRQLDQLAELNPKAHRVVFGFPDEETADPQETIKLDELRVAVEELVTLVSSDRFEDAGTYWLEGSFYGGPSTRFKSTGLFQIEENLTTNNWHEIFTDENKCVLIEYQRHGPQDFREIGRSPLTADTELMAGQYGKLRVIKTPSKRTVAKELKKLAKFLSTVTQPTIVKAFVS